MNYLGLVKWFKPEQEFGVITTLEEGDIFLHHIFNNNIPPKIFQGTALIFEIRKERGVTIAVKVHKPTDYDDFAFILAYLSKPHSFLTINKALVQQFIGRPIDEVLTFFKQYFDSTYSESYNDKSLKFFTLLKGITRKLKIDNSNMKVQELIDNCLQRISYELLFKVWKQKLHLAASNDRSMFVSSKLPRNQKKTILQVEEDTSSFTFPESIFLENYTLIGSKELHRISKLSNGDQNVSKILLKKIDSFSSINQDIDQVIQFISLLKIVNSKRRAQELINNCLQRIGHELLFKVWKQKLYLSDSNDRSMFVSSKLHRNQKKIILQVEEDTSSFTFPESIFLENYTLIGSKELHRISKLSNGDQIVSEILLKKIDSFSSINQDDIDQVTQFVSLISQEESNEQIKHQLSDKLLSFLLQLDYLNDEKDTIEDFRFVIDILKSKIGEPYNKTTIEKFNESVNNDTKYALWQKTRYFEPSIEFFRQNNSRLTYKDFIKGNDEFHQEYFQNGYNELGEALDIKTFGLLICLVVETPIKVIPDIFENLSFPYQVALWLNFPRAESYKGKYYEANYKTADILIEPSSVIDYLSQLISIDEILNSWKIVKSIQESYNTKTSSYGTTEGFRKLDRQARKQLISDEISKPGGQIIDFLKAALNRAGPNNSLLLIKSLIPKFINEEQVPFKQLIELLQEVEISENVRKEVFDYISQTTSISNRVSLWFNGHSTNIDLDEIIEEFSGFSKCKQTKLLRKTFSLVQSKKVSSIDHFAEKLLTLSTKQNINLDVRICLEVISSLRTNTSYIGENNISEIICQYVNEDIKKIIQIYDLFEDCRGRTWMTNGEHKRNWYLTIEGKEFLVSDNSVNIGDQDYSLDKKNRSLVIDGTNYNFKWLKKEHNIFAKLYKCPSGVTFCDAVKSGYDEQLRRHFYWCCNAKCYAPCQEDHIHLEWHKYSLRDFIKILNLPFEDEKYYRFVSVVNRANQLLKKLQCSSCQKLLRDARTSKFAFYRVTTFHCANPECPEYHKVVYLNHCLNWKCRNVVDSRISKKCPNGWYICDSCSNCCSQGKIDRRYENLITNNTFNPNNPRHQKLKHQVDNKLGHLEKGMKYDHKSGNPMENNGNEGTRSKPSWLNL